MRKLSGTLVVLVLALGAIVGVASATHTNGEGPDKDFANGTGFAPINIFGVFYDSQQHVNGQTTDPTGQTADGHFFTTVFAFGGPGNDVSVSGDITCLNAIGNQEVNRGVITAENSFAPLGLVGQTVIGKNVDNDLNPGQDPPDLTGGFITVGVPVGAPCPPAVFPLPVTAVERGNFVVHDGI
jgi:hypothetical protein